MREREDRRKGRDESVGDNEETETPITVSSRLRARKQVSYVQNEPEIESDNDDTDKDTKDDEWKADEAESPSRTRRKLPVKRPPSVSSTSVDASSDEDDDYMKMRQNNIKERLELVKSLGIVELKEELGGPSKKKTNQKKKPPTPREKSKRLKTIVDDKIAREARRKLGKPSPKKSRSDIVHSTLENLRVTIAKATSRKPSGPLPMLSLKTSREENTEDDPDDAASKCADFVSLLRPFLVHRGDESQLSTCSLDTFKKIVSRLSITEEMIAKTNTARITSMAFHPGEEKVLVASGSTSGDLGLWDVYNPDEEKCVEVLGPHTSQVNCTSFDRCNPAKIITTSLDGTVRRGDLLKLVFDEIWAHEQNGPNFHATWHDQVDPNTLMVAHGTGRVVVIDCRKPMSPVGWFHCHERSVRTVQKHPQENKFFVTSSRLGQVRIWDWRMMDKEKPEPVWDLVHPKGLSSAFFSCKGNLLLTTCNDDRLRVYHTALLPGASKPKVVTNIKHDNHTGPWTSAFKAMWHPQREDVFMVGSMEKNPRKLQIYGIHGQPVYNLTSNEHLLTIPAVHAWHPTLPLIAAGNASGRVHVFR
ncbi:WD repeat-containing protein 76-like [Frankliniella occidentalis]|uniref:WD repeat-containing protein 76 n=1 Tax=Frankliniella occidentalis TaxID=133901 RepID=A0A6J1RWL7_FRAOC|nr:WD repeat-containing protein 76-like [Frankliniella occidentalis]